MYKSVLKEQKEIQVGVQIVAFQNVCKSFEPTAAWRVDHCSTHNYNGFFSFFREKWHEDERMNENRIM